MKGSSILFFAENHYEDLELQYPKYRLLETGVQIVVDGHFISSRYPEDLSFFCPEIIKCLQAARQSV